MDSDEELTLSASTLAALQQFKQEETQKKEEFERLYKQLEERFQRQKFSIDAFKEDWQLSQFWYSDSTSDVFARALLEDASEDTVIVIASAPAVYASITRMPEEQVPTKHIYLLEYDTRFEVMAGKQHFFKYDYNRPDDVPQALRHKCHRILIDPPFLEEECQTKSAQAARNLLVETAESSGGEEVRIVSSTGERMKDIMAKTYPETRLTTFLPEHKNGLSNEFRCYASFECQQWKFDDAGAV